MPALVHDPQPALRVVHAAAERPAERAVPAVLGIVGAAAGPGAALALLSLEVGAELLGRLGDVAVGVVHGELDHRSLLGCTASVHRLTARVPRPVQAVSPSGDGSRDRIGLPGFWPTRWALASRARARRNRAMSSPKVFIFAPVDEARDSQQRLEAEGCELRLGKASWDTPQGNGEPELVRMAQGAHALMGTSIRNVPDQPHDHGELARASDRREVHDRRRRHRRRGGDRHGDPRVPRSDRVELGRRRRGYDHRDAEHAQEGSGA